MAPEITELRENWDALGRDRPISAIVSTLGAGDEQQFFASGRVEVASVLGVLADLGIEAAGPALDFGCGIGRLTQALAEHFDEVVGLDIAASMIGGARALNRFPDRCSYVLNEGDALGVLDDCRFGFALSSIVLQHVGPDLVRRYLPELLRVLRPGGVLFFQLPAALRPAAELSAEASRAVISLEGALPPASTGTTLEVAVTVQNASRCIWEPDHRLSIGRRWLDAATGALLVYADDGSRVPLHRPLPPGAQFRCQMRVPAPARAGSYLLELDLSQPGAPLFGDLGSTPLRTLVSVHAPRNPRRDLATRLRRVLARLGQRHHVQTTTELAALAPLVAHLEMHGLPRQEVVGILAAHGAQVVAVLDDESAGPEWSSFCYVAVRR